MFRDGYNILIPAIIVDVFFIFDIILNFTRFSFYDETTGELIVQRKLITRHYTSSSSFIIDIVAALPLDFLAFAPGIGLRYLPLLRLVKIFRILHLYEYFENAEQIIMEFWHGFSAAKRKLVRLYFLLIVVCHWAACGWYLCGQLAEQGIDVGLRPALSASSGNSTSPVQRALGWIETDRTSPSRSIEPGDGNGLVGYLRALYFILVGTSTVGYGDIVPTNLLETIYATVTMLFGGLLKPAIVGGIASLVFITMSSREDIRVTQYAQAISKFSSQENLPVVFVERALRYCNYLRSCECLAVEQEVLNAIPRGLRARIIDSLIGDIVRSLPIWGASVDADLCDDIMTCCRPRHYLPDDYIIYQDEAGTSIYFLCRGTAHVKMSGSTVIVARLSEGQFFGETALLTEKSRRTSNVIATCFCDCFVLGREDFEKVIRSHALDRKDIELSIRESLQKKSSENREQIRFCSNLSPSGGRSGNAQGEPQQLLSSAPRSRAIRNTAEEKGVAKEEARSKESRRVLRRSDSFQVNMADLRAWRHPDSKFRFYWNLVVAFGIYYNLILVPLRLASFATPLETFAIDYFLDALILSDCVLRSRWFDKVMRGKLVKNGDELWKMYRRHSLAVDVFACFPFDIIIFIALFDRKDVALWVSVGRIPKLVHLRHVKRLVAQFYTHNWLYRMLGLIALVFTTAHIGCCIFYFIAVHERDDRSSCAPGDGLCEWKGTWIGLQIKDDLLPADGGSQASRYIRAFNWALPTLVVVVIGDVTPVSFTETLFVTCVIFFGLVVNAIVLGVTSDILTDTKSDRAVFREKFNAMERWLLINNLTSNSLLCERVRNHLQMNFDLTGGLDEQLVFEKLPRQLRHDAATFSRTIFFRKTRIFQDSSRAFIQRLAEELEVQYFSAGDIICRAGERATRAFFLKRGNVYLSFLDKNHASRTPCPGGKKTPSVRQEMKKADESSGDLHKEVPEGSSFGVAALVRDDSFHFAAEVIGYAATYVLRRRCFLKAAARFPEEVVRMKKSIASEEREAVQEAGTVSVHFRAVTLDQEMAHWATWEARWQPFSFFRDCWDFFSLMSILYLATMVPLRIAILREEKVRSTELAMWYFLDYVVDAFYLVDIFLHARRFQIQDKGRRLVKSPGGIMLQYCRTRLKLDVVACFPLEFLTAWGGVGWLKFCRLNRMLHLLRLNTHFVGVERFMHQRWRVWMASVYLLFAKVWLMFWLCNHWAACGWLIIHRYAERSVAMTWATADGLASFSLAEGQHNIFHSRWDAYLRAFYFVIVVISTCGYGDIRPRTDLETIFAQVVTLGGAIGFASMVGSFLAYFEYADKHCAPALKERHKAVTLYGKSVGWTRVKTLQHEAQCIALWEGTRFLPARDLMSSLSPSLRHEIAAVTMRSLIDSANVFQVIRDDESTQLFFASCLEQEIFVSHQQIYELGEPSTGLFLVSSGSVILSADGDTIVGRGMHFGRWSSHLRCRVDAAVAREHSTVFRCSEEHFGDVLECLRSRDQAEDLRRMFVDTSEFHSLQSFPLRAHSSAETNRARFPYFRREESDGSATFYTPFREEVVSGEYYCCEEDATVVL